MAAPRRRSPASVIDSLFRTPGRFEFFQAVRLLEWNARRDAGDDRLVPGKPVGPGKPLGQDHDPRHEVVRLRADVSLTYPGTELTATTTEPPADGRPGTLTVTVMGLVGAMGVLPQHYTELVVKALRNRSYGLRDFLDLLHHRSLSLFYRAWAKYRLPVSVEQADARGGADPATTAVSSFVGLGTPALAKRMAVGDGTLLHYAGLLSHEVRSAAGLQAMLSDLFACPVAVDSFVGGWIPIPEPEQSRLPGHSPGPGQPDGRHCRLGVDAVAGTRVWDVQGRFRVRIGPLDHRRFAAFLPDGAEMAEMRDLVRFYAGPDLDVDVQVVLRADAVPPCRLEGRDGTPGTRLGWDSWVLEGASPADRGDAVFTLETEWNGS